MYDNNKPNLLLCDNSIKKKCHLILSAEPL